MCSVTSVLYHITYAKYMFWLDVIVVNTIGAGYVYDAMVYRHGLYYWLTILWSMFTIYVYMCTRTRAYSYHALVHMSAVTGIMCYVRGRIYDGFYDDI